MTQDNSILMETGERFSAIPVTAESKFTPGQLVRIIRTDNPAIYLYSVPGEGGPQIAYCISPPYSPYFSGEKYPIYESHIQ